ncbi:sucrase ferredoxin [Amycolatopsis azurea]|uniref:sucrase ferredoxin n=1 Tax=Amycolatopsis azurea TaxID=36819 RepID=UPI00380E0E02
MTAAPDAERGRCADLADAANDPAEGTAPPAERWLLIEHPGPWGRLALTDSGIDPAALGSLTSWAARVQGRIALIRRGSRRSLASPRAFRWFRIDARPGHEEIRTGVFTDAAGLAAVPFSDGEPLAQPLALVCVHGRHDTCCAVRGRSLAATLAAEYPEETWECSHIGGCRFAPSLVLLPHGYTYGGLRPGEAVDVVRRYTRGTLDPRGLRGRSSLKPHVQAAQHHARAATGATGIDDLRPRDEAPDADSGSWVGFAEPECSVHLREKYVPANRPLTCASPPASRIRVFELLEFR